MQEINMHETDQLSPLKKRKNNVKNHICSVKIKNPPQNNLPTGETKNDWKKQHFSMGNTKPFFTISLGHSQQQFLQFISFFNFIFWGRPVRYRGFMQLVHISGPLSCPHQRWIFFMEDQVQHICMSQFTTTQGLKRGWHICQYWNKKSNNNFQLFHKKWKTHCIPLFDDNINSFITRHC